MMHSDSRVKEPVCLATTSLPDPCLSTYLSPRLREEPKETVLEHSAIVSILAMLIGQFAGEKGDYDLMPS